MRVKLVKKQDEAEGTKSFFFRPESHYRYKAGQATHLVLLKLTHEDPKGNSRYFTVSSSPTEGEDLRITTRLRGSGYKTTLDEMEIGSEVEAESASGNFVISETDKGPHVLLAGGIGVTPFRSMIKNIVDKNLDTEIYLICSNRTEEETTFKEEFEDIAKSHKNIHVKFIYTKTDGHLDKEKLTKIIGDWNLEIGNLVYYLAGPSGFVDAMYELLYKLKVPEDSIIEEKFPGY